MMSDEKDLLKKSKQGNVEAFECLIEGYQKKVFNIAYRMLGNHEDAFDVAQEAFIRAFRSIGDFKEEASFSTWIYRITTNVCLDELRRRKRRITTSIDEGIKFEDREIKREVVDDSPTPDIIVERNEIQHIVRDAINKLSQEHKIVIVLRDIQGFSYDEISKIIKCPEGTVKSRINRARRALKEILETKKELFNKEYVN